MPSGVAARHDAALLATALVPEIEHIVAEALAKSLAFAGQHGQSEGHIGSIDARLMAAKTPSIRARPATTADRAPAASTNANEFGAAAEARRKEEEEAAARDRRAMDEREESETRAKTGEEEEWKAKEREKEKKEREKEREKEKEKERERRSTSGEKVNSKALTEDEVKKIHSAIRWNKPLGELAGLIVGPEQANCEDPRNGNRPLHIASAKRLHAHLQTPRRQGRGDQRCERQGQHRVAHGAGVRLRRVRRVSVQLRGGRIHRQQRGTRREERPRG